MTIYGILFLKAVFLLSNNVDFSAGFSRAALFYHHPRDSSAYARHVMRVNTETHQYTGQWTFDSFVLCTVNDRLFYHGENQTEETLKDELATFITDAEGLEKSILSLKQSWELPSFKWQIFISVPYFPPFGSISLGGKRYELTHRQQRLNALQWYLDEVEKSLSSKLWPYFNFGLYYYRETMYQEVYDDKYFIQSFNLMAKRMDFETLWAPGYSTDKAFEGRHLLGFNHVVIQPGYTFRTTLHGLSVQADRLRSAVSKALENRMCIVYEFGGYSVNYDILYNELAHQYLGIGNLCSWYPQLFFSSGYDLMDRVYESPQIKEAYTDVMNYLKRPAAGNYERRMMKKYDWTNTRSGIGSISINNYEYVVSSEFEGLNGIRMDFEDPIYSWSPTWTGRITVSIEGHNLKYYAQRVTKDQVNKHYNSVFVPLAHLNLKKGDKIHVKGPSGYYSVPRIHGVYVTKREPKMITNLLYGAASTATRYHKAIGNGDSAETHIKYTEGKLTDGNRGFNLNFGIGWIPEQQFIITIDLGVITKVSRVEIHGYNDIRGQLRLTRNVVVLYSEKCEPQEKGFYSDSISSCLPDGVIANLTVYPQGSSGSLRKEMIRIDSKYPAKARFVQINGVGDLWTLLDEIEVYADNGELVSRRKPYKVTPMPGIYAEGGHGNHYLDNSRLLTDGAVFERWTDPVSSNRNMVRLQKSEGGKDSIAVVWNTAHTNLKHAIVWLVKEHPEANNYIPSSAHVNWRDEKDQWFYGGEAVPSKCAGTIPCLKYLFRETDKVTGLHIAFPLSNLAVYVTEVSLEPIVV